MADQLEGAVAPLLLAVQLVGLAGPMRAVSIAIVLELVEVRAPVVVPSPE